MLQDLRPLLAETEESIANYNLSEQTPPQAFQRRYSTLLVKDSNSHISWKNQTLSYQTQQGLKIICPYQWFYLAKLAHPFAKGLFEYKQAFRAIFVNEPAATLKQIAKSAKEDGVIEAATQNRIEAFFEFPEDVTKFTEWLTNYDFWKGSKTIDRGDFIVSPVLNAAKMVHHAQGYLADISYNYLNDEQLVDLLDAPEVEAQAAAVPPEIQRVTGGNNFIIYGAPGTGKSHNADKSLEEGTWARTVFHPDTTIQDFVGTYRPCKVNGNFSYEYVPGPFISALCTALVDPQNMYTLIIEEINRANASAVFGEIFQLLDREEDGTSTYPVTPDDALLNYLKSQLPDWDGRLRIPSNLTIIATMNSADQGVFPMDSAFKRRWKFEFLPIDFEHAPHRDDKLKYAGEEVAWKVFAQAINGKLAEIGINEDRHIGPFFLKQNELDSPKAISSKLLIYLWDDVVRHQRTSLFKEEFKTFSQLASAYEVNKEVFSFPVSIRQKENLEAED